MALTQALTLSVSPSIGTVSAELIAPETCTAICTLAHGAGAGMQHAFMVALANRLGEQGISTLRFNFPFAEGKKGRPDMPAVAHKTIEAALQQARSLFPSLPLYAAGKSFGGRMSSQWVATGKNTPVHGLIFYGFPLHPPKQPATDRADHLKGIPVPMLLLQGTRDELATWSLIEEVCGKLPKATLVKIEGADHAFKAGKSDTVSMLALETKKWATGELTIDN